MSKNVAMFVDVANLYYAARGQDVDVDYTALLKHATKGRDLIRAYAYSGLDPENENQRKFIDFLGKNGYKVVHKDIRKFGDGRMKANLDIELVVDLFRLADRMDIAVIVSGDGDFAPAIRALQDKGVRCEVVSFRPNTSSDLIAVADEFFDIMKVASIERKKSARSGMSAPEMPAKEVNPEFGFREASPSVAAAALAALRGGESARPEGRGRGRRGTGTSRGGRAEGRAAEPVAAVAAAEAPVDAEEQEQQPVAAATDGQLDGEQRRRRRRRGGRGRGRRRAGEAAVGEGAEAPVEGEIGWQEFDDLSQLDELGGQPVEDEEELLLLEGADEGLAVPEEGEIGFSEVDAETLAELGLAPAAAEEPAPRPRRRRTRAAAAEGAEPADAVVTEAAQAVSEAKAERSTRTRRRTKKSEEAAPAPSEAGDAAATEAPPTPRARRSRSTKAAGAATEPTKGADEAEPAKPARTRRRKATSDESATASGAEEGAEPQGIWQRFRSARTDR